METRTAKAGNALAKFSSQSVAMALDSLACLAHTASSCCTMFFWTLAAFCSTSIFSNSASVSVWAIFNFGWRAIKSCFMVSTASAVSCSFVRPLEYLNINHIEKKVSIDHARPLCISTSNKHKTIHVRLQSTVHVIRACLCIVLSVREVARRVPPTWTRNTYRRVSWAMSLRFWSSNFVKVASISK